MVARINFNFPGYRIGRIKVSLQCDEVGATGKKGTDSLAGSVAIKQGEMHQVQRG